jgi:nicotinamide mononucleotide transporter
LNEKNSSIWAALSPLETAAVACSLLYTFFYARGAIIAWMFGALASVLFLILVARSGLLAETVTHAFYLLSAAYGFLAQSGWGAEWGWMSPPFNRWTALEHLIWIAFTAASGVLAGYFLSKNPRAKMPFFDAQTTVFSILATVLMVRFDPANWFYWLAVDAASAILYARRKLSLSALLYVLYTAMAAYGVWTAYGR